MSNSMPEFIHDTPRHSIKISLHSDSWMPRVSWYSLNCASRHMSTEATNQHKFCAMPPSRSFSGASRQSRANKSNSQTLEHMFA